MKGGAGQTSGRTAGGAISYPVAPAQRGFKPGLSIESEEAVQLRILSSLHLRTITNAGSTNFTGGKI